MKRIFSIIVLVSAILTLSGALANSDAFRQALERGKAQRAAGEYEAALPDYETALDLSTQELGADHDVTVSIMEELATLQVIVGNTDQARPLLNQAIAIRERLSGPDDPAIAENVKWLALLELSGGRFAEAENHYQRAIAIHERAHGKTSHQVADAIEALARMHKLRQHHELAVPLLERARDIYRQGGPVSAPSQMRVLIELADVYRSLGRAEDAEAAMENAMRIIAESRQSN